MKFLKQFAGDKINSLKPMMESMAIVAPYISKTTVKNEVECCYTFDYPKANIFVEKGHGHMSYSFEHTDKYVKWLKDIIRETLKNVINDNGLHIQNATYQYVSCILYIPMR